MSGTVMSGAALRHVSFVDCHMDGVNLRMTEGKWLRFDDCHMQEADFYDSALVDTSFVRCDLARAALSKARFTATSFTGGSLVDVRGVLALKGVKLSSELVLPLVPSLLDALEITVLEESGEGRSVE